MDGADRAAGDRVSWDGMAVVGVVARTHGLRGELVVNPETDFPDVRFRAGSTLFLLRDGEPRAFRVRTARWHRGRPMIAFEGMATLDEAEQLRDAELRVPEDWLLPLPPDTYYEHELIGCKVRTVGGDAIGTVRRLEGPAGARRLIVGEGPQEIDVPLAVRICVSVEPAAATIVIDPPDGLLEVNRTKAWEVARIEDARPAPAVRCAETDG